MATLEEMTNALREADRQGNTEDAQRIARLIQNARNQPQQPEQQEPLSGGEIVSGLGQTALTLGTGALAEPIAGIAGITRGAIGGILGEEDVMSNMTDTIDWWRDKITVEPFTESGRRVTETVAAPFEYYFRKSEEKGVEDLARTGSPEVATLTQTGMEFLPAALGMRGLRKVPKGEIRRAEQFAREEGINIRRRGEPLREEVAEAGRRRTDPVKGRSMEGVVGTVQAAAKAAKEGVRENYRIARSKRAGIPVEEAIKVPDLVRQTYRDMGFDLRRMRENMPRVQNRLDEMDEIANLPRNSEVTLRAIDDFKKSINRNRPARTDEAQNAALDVMLSQVKSWEDAMFNADMISGDPTALAAWRKARSSVADYKKRFKEDKIIAQMAREGVTPPEARSWIFGASSVGAKKEAFKTVRTLKEILGEKSPEFTAMRSDAMFDVMEPLFKDDPSLKAFVNKYDQMVSRNELMSKELFGESLSEFKQLRDFASAAVRRGDPPDFGSLFPRVVSVLSFGHGIAKQALKVTGMQRVINVLRESNNKELFLRELFDDPIESPILGRVMRTGAVTQGAEQLSDQESRQPLGAAAQ